MATVRFFTSGESKEGSRGRKETRGRGVVNFEGRENDLPARKVQGLGGLVQGLVTFIRRAI
jgi:hypothetical protein